MIQRMPSTSYPTQSQSQPRQLPAFGRGLAASGPSQPAVLKQAPGPQIYASRAPTFFQGGGAGYSNEFGQAAAQGQAAKDQAAFGALGGLGIAGQNAIGQYGVSRNNALANQSVAAANAYGQMANSYYNTLGQLGNFAGNMTAAGLNAGAQSASGSQSANFNMGGGGSFGGGGGMGFNVSGPEGTIASGGMGGGRGGRSFGGSGGGGFSSSVTRGASSGERTGMVNQGYGFLNNLRGDLNRDDNQAMALAGLMGNEFGANRAAVMDPSVMNSLNGQLSAGYGAIGDLYGMSDYGFNTPSQGPRPQFTSDAGSPAYWMNPGKASYADRPRAGGGRFR